MTLLINHATVITVDPDRRVLGDCSIVIANDKITALAPSHELENLYRDATTVIDATGKVVLPGFVSAHNHVGYAVFRGRAEDVGYAPTHRLYLPMSGVITNSEREVIGALAVTELLRGGVTTILEMEEDAELFASSIESSGIRAFIGVMVNDVNLDALASGQTVFDDTVRTQQLSSYRACRTLAWPVRRSNPGADGRQWSVDVVAGAS